MRAREKFAFKWAITYKSNEANLPSFDEIMKGIFKFLVHQMEDRMKSKDA